MNRHPDTLHHAGVPVAVDHTAGTAVASAVRIVQFVNGTERLFPIMAAPEIQISVQVEKLVAAQTGKTLFFLSFRHRSSCQTASIMAENR